MDGSSGRAGNDSAAVQQLESEVTQRLTEIEKAILSNTQSNRELTTAIKGQQVGTERLIEQNDRVLEEFKAVVANVLDIRNGVTPPGYMRISDHERQIEILALQSAKTATDASKTQEKLFNKTLLTFGSITGLCLLMIATLMLGSGVAIHLPKFLGGL